MKRISEAFFARPWAVNETTLLVMKEIVDRHLRGEKLSIEDIQARIGDNKKEDASYEVVDGSAIIPIYGIISKRMTWFKMLCGGASTQGIRNQMKEALEDPNVKQILLDIDSPGGSVDGTPELAEFIYSSRGRKPIHAYASGQMCSAAYWIGSAADKIYATKATEVGSIGVFAVISDYTVQNHNDGIRTDVVRAGSFKATGHPDRYFSAEDRAIVQTEVNTYYELFIEAVAKNQGISIDEAKKLADGRVHIGRQALDAGLIDGIDEIESAISAGANQNKKIRVSVEGKEDVDIQNISKKPQETADNSKQEGNTMDLKDLSIDQLRVGRPDLCNTLIAEGKAAGVEEGKAAGMAEGKTAGVKEERERAAAIVKAANTEFKGMGMEALTEEAIEQGKTLDASLAGMRKKRLDDVAQNGNKVPGPDAEHQTKDDLVTKAEDYQKEHKCSFADAMRAVSPKRSLGK
jgi:signal peptide peptidase SppA